MKKVLDCEQSWTEFRYGFTKQGERFQTVPIKKIFLEESWKLETGEYRSANSLVYSGKDIAILLLQRQIKAKKYPQLLPYDGNAKKEFQIQIYGYPVGCKKDHKEASILRVGTGDTTLTTDNYEDGWGYFRHKIHLFHGMYCTCFFFCVLCMFLKTKTSV